MSNFENRNKQPWTTYDNELIQKKTVFKNANQKLTFMFLYSYANAHKIFPSMDSIADSICATSRTAMKVIQELEEMTFIEVKRELGKSNNYILNDYFEVAAKLTSENFSPVEKSYSEPDETDEKQDERTRENFSPVKDFHQTSEEFSLVPVKNFHPKTKTTKITKENKKLVSSSSEEIHLHDLSLQGVFPEIPVEAFETVKAKLFRDAEEGKIKMKSVDQYFALMAKRLEFYRESQSKRTETAQIETKETEPSILSTESVTANLSQSEKPESVQNHSEEVAKEVPKPSEDTKKAIEETLKKVATGEQTPEERAKAKENIERMLQQLREQKGIDSKKPPIKGDLA